jgi:hypothetical protein
MAQGKKNVIVYADWINKFEELEDDEAGRLIKHFFRYVNDLNPEYPDRTTKLMFIDIKATLKRDLGKWEETSPQRIEKARVAGLASAEARKLKKELNSTNELEIQLNPTKSTVSVSVSVSDNVNVKESNSIDTRKSKFAHTLKPFLDIYSKETIREFYDYWTEPNKSNTKFRQELQKTWSVNRRLETWNNNNFNKQQNGKSKITDSKQFGEIVEAIRSTGERI